MPPARSLERSRRARSAAGRSSPSSPSRMGGSATSRSLVSGGLPLGPAWAPATGVPASLLSPPDPPAPARSSTNSRLTRSSPALERRNATREPSGATLKLRGRPRVKRWLRAERRGNDSASDTAGEPGHGDHHGGTDQQAGQHQIGDDALGGRLAVRDHQHDDSEGKVAGTEQLPPEQAVFCFQAEDGIRDFHVTGVQTVHFR